MKTNLIKTILSCFLFACGLVVLAAAAMMPVDTGAAQERNLVPSCGVYTLRGSYIFATHGWNIVGGIAQPKAIVEGIEFNGDGTLVSPFATVSINGTIMRSGGGTGSYTVNSDCTGTLSFNMGPSFDIFVDPMGRQLWMIQTGGAVPAVFEGTATRVSR